MPFPPDPLTPEEIRQATRCVKEARRKAGGAWRNLTQR